MSRMLTIVVLGALEVMAGLGLALAQATGDAAFLFSVTDRNGLTRVEQSTVVPLIPDRACYEWRLRLGSEQELVTATEVFTLPAKPQAWGGVDGDVYSASELSEDRMIARTTLFMTPKDGWIAHGWCVADGDPVGRYSIKVYVGDQPVHEFGFTVESIEGAPE